MGGQVVVDYMDKPGVRDRQNFDLHWSVDYWQNFTLPPAIEDSGNAPIPSRCPPLPAELPSPTMKAWEILWRARN